MEKHVIYNVNKEEYDTCRILSDSPRIIGFCTEPTRERLFTISFRSFSPKPNSIEFQRGKSYYFISTSSPGDLRTKQGGYCVHNNMKVRLDKARQALISVTFRQKSGLLGSSPPVVVVRP